MFNIGAGEMVFILVAALLILGPQRLPELARGIGKFLREFRRQTDEVRNVVEREFYAMDQEIGEPPTAPVRPGTRFAPQPPQVVGGPEATLPPATDGASPPADAASPQSSSPPQVLEMDAQGPREVATSDVHAGETPAQDAATAEPGAEPTAEAPPEPTASSATSPTLSPIPGTVARNAPKRS